MQVHLDSALFLAQTNFCLAHVVGYTVLPDESLGLGLVVELHCGEESLLKVLPVDLEVLLGAVGLIETQRDCELTMYV